MILDIISFVLLLAILGILFLVLKRVAAMKNPYPVPVREPETSESLPEEVSDFDEIREAFIAYTDRESDILRLDNFGSAAYIGYESGYPSQNGYRQIWIAAWLPDDRNDIAAVISIQSNSGYYESHYKAFEAHKGRIEKTFSFGEVKLRAAGGNVLQLYVVKQGVDLTQTANRDAAFRWLRENLEKLYWVIHVQKTLGWDTAVSTGNSSEDDIPF